MIDALILDSIVPEAHYSRSSIYDCIQVAPGGLHERPDPRQHPTAVRTHEEVAQKLFDSGIEPCVRSASYVRDLENRALRKLRHHPAMKDIYRECFGKEAAEMA